MHRSHVLPVIVSVVGRRAGATCILQGAVRVFVALGALGGSRTHRGLRTGGTIAALAVALGDALSTNKATKLTEPALHGEEEEPV